VWGTNREILQQYPDSGWWQQAPPDELTTLLSVPLLQEGEAIGVINLRRAGGVPFSPEQVTLVESFADQAVIAIENTRLVEREQQSNRELGEALEQQTAIAEVLGIISRAPADLAAVLPVLTQRAVTLIGAETGYISRTVSERDGVVRAVLTTYTRDAA